LTTPLPTINRSVKFFFAMSATEQGLNLGYDQRPRRSLAAEQRRIEVKTPKANRRALFLKICPETWLRGGKREVTFGGK
jgi:hypothetical protein